MSEYKLVPVEPTKEQIAEFQSMWTKGFCDDQMARNCYKALMDAAPAVQGEPVFMWHRGATDDESEVVDVDCACPCCVPLYTAPQPTEQQPDDRAAVRIDKQCREDVAAALGFVRGGNYAWSYLLQQIKETTSAEGKQTAPDVSKLSREALAELIKGMAVSVDVSMGESDFGNRYFGVVDEVQWNANERHGMMLLVQEPEANFSTPVSPDVAEDEL